MRKLLTFVLFCSVFFAAAIARAQQTLGSLNGTVLDGSGAAVPDSTVTVTDAEIGVTRTTKAAGNGYFQIFNLPVGTYTMSATHAGFDTTELKGIQVQEAQAKTLTVSLKVGQASESVEVTANPLLNATDATNGYTLDSAQIELTPLATGSFTQLAVLSPGVSAELLANLDSNSGLGNQPIWANGQRDTSNTFQVNGVDATNLFNGKTSSGSSSQRYAFNIGQGSPIGGAAGVGTSVYGSNGNSLPSPPPEFLQEIRVNTSMYDAQQGATSGAQIDANTNSGTNKYHGQMYGSFANNALNSAPFFFRQQYLLGTQGVGDFPEALANPSLHRWTAGGTIGGPIIKDKLFFFLAYQHRYNSDQSTAISQMTVPNELTDDRSTTGIDAAANSWAGPAATPFTGAIDPIAMALLSAKLPNGQFLIPSTQAPGQAIQYSVPNVTLFGTSMLTADQMAASVDYDVSKTDRLSVKYYYQNDPINKPYGFSQTGGFPVTQDNGSQVFAIDNTITIGSKINWEQRLGYDRMRSYSFYNQTLSADPTLGANYGIGSAAADPSKYAPGVLPGLDLAEFAYNNTASPSLTVGPYSAFVNTGYYQNRINPSTNVIFTVGKHTIVAGGGYSYTQLNIENNRQGHAEVKTKTFESFLAGSVQSSSVLESIDPVSLRNNADRYYRSNEIAGYVQDKWQALSNLSITAGVRYDYHGGLTEKYGNLFNFDPSLYDVTGTVAGGFQVGNAGFVIAGNNKYDPTHGTSDSTLSGRQWGVSPRVGFAYSPKKFGGKVVINGGAGMYYDRGELFTYLSQPAGSGNGGPFGVTESAPLSSYVTGKGKKLNDPLGAAFTTVANGGSYNPPSSDPSTITAALKTVLGTGPSNLPGGSSYGYSGSANPGSGQNCSGVDNQANYTDCPDALNFGAYDKNNVLPYTINFALNMQWQPRNDLAVTIGYSGTRGRHSVIPIPFNEPGLATPDNPIHGETATYGFEVLNTNVAGDSDGDFAAIGSEPWNSEDGGNADFRAPYIGFSPNAALFKTVGQSAYDSLQVHVEKRMSHHVQAGVSYTWGHALDEQSDIGLFFTGNNPNNLRDSYASSDFDRTHTVTANFVAQLPNVAKPHSLLSYATNDWSLTGIAVVQSGEPYSLYEFYGAVGSAYFGDYPTLLNPILPIKDPKAAKSSALTGNPGDFRGTGGEYLPTVDPSQIAINYLAPGQKGVPTAAQGNPGDPVDIYETDFAPNNQRNIFRQAMQKRLDVSFRKSFKLSDRFALQYAFNIFNITNTTSLDVPQDQTQIRQADACSTGAANLYNCKHDYVNYGQIATSASTADQQSALTNLDQLPYYTGSGKSLAIPTTLPVGTLSCTSAKTVSSGGCPNNGANFGSVTGTIGGNRAITMDLHFVF
jgi:hypothetical protein